MPEISALALFFTCTTILVFAFPIARLAPFWLERRLGRSIRFHRRAAEALAIAMQRSHNDPDHHARLAAQHAWHVAALQALAPEAGETKEPRRRAA